jgi:hypothetical protein
LSAPLSFGAFALARPDLDLLATSLALYDRTQDAEDLPAMQGRLLQTRTTGTSTRCSAMNHTWSS